MFVMAALLLITSSASAYDVRAMTLGNAPYWKDAGDVNIWYGEIANYGDMVWINFDDALDGSELNLAKNEDSFGTYFLSIGSDDGEKVGLGYGYSLDAATIGLFFQLYEKVDMDVDPDLEASKYDFGAGIDYDMGDTNVDFTFMFGKTGDDSDMSFGVRAFYPWKDGVELVPAFSYAKYASGSDDVDDITNIFFGLGFGYTVNDDNTLILGFEYDSWKVYNPMTHAFGNDVEYTEMPAFYVGMEHDVNDWLTVRSSGEKVWGSDQDDNNNFDFMFTFGFGIHLGDFDLDVAYHESQLFDTFNWFMGGPDGLGVYALQIKYYF